MQYKRLLEKIAEQYHTTPAEADKEIKRAIKAAGYDMPPELFIALAARKVSNQAADFIDRQ